MYNNNLGFKIKQYKKIFYLDLLMMKRNINKL